MAGTRFQLRRGTTTPTASDLLEGELGLNVQTGDLYTKNNSGSVIQLNGGSSPPVAGSNAAVFLYNWSNFH